MATAASVSVDPGVVEQACTRAASRLQQDRSLTGLSTALTELWESSDEAVLAAAFSLEAESLWVVAQAGYSFVPDGLAADRGVIGASVLSRAPVFVPEVSIEPAYVAGVDGIRSELAVPVLVGDEVVGVCNFESALTLSDAAVASLTSFSALCGESFAAMHSAQRLDVGAVARVLVQATTLRDVSGIAELAARTLGRLYSAETAQLNLVPGYELLGHWTADAEEPLTPSEIGAIATSAPTRGLLSVVDCAEVDVAPVDGSAICLYLRAGGEDVAVAVIRCDRIDALDFERAELAMLVAAHTAASIESAEALARERRAATTDLLTGVLNRRGFERAFAGEVDRCRRTRRPLTIALFDCDDFKRVNDTSGHAAGDELLRRMGAFLVGGTRSWDSPARLGGDEFAVLLPETGPAAAEQVVARLQRGLNDVCALAGYTLTASFGLASFPDDGDTADALLGCADQALYGAKHSGKDRALGYEEFRRLLDDASEPAIVGSLVTLVSTMDAGYLYDGAHSQVVARLARGIGEHLGRRGADAERLYLAGLLHDIGKAGIPESILKKPERLTDREWLEVKRHPLIGANMLERLRDDEIRDWIRWHHERLDGAGYPDALPEPEIPLGARILAVADAYEAMTSVRPYRGALSREEALAELRANIGTQFDQRVVDALVAVLDEAAAGD